MGFAQAASNTLVRQNSEACPAAAASCRSTEGPRGVRQGPIYIMPLGRSCPCSSAPGSSPSYHLSLSPPHLLLRALRQVVVNKGLHEGLCAAGRTTEGVAGRHTQGCQARCLARSELL